MNRVKRAVYLQHTVPVPAEAAATAGMIAIPAAVPVNLNQQSLRHSRSRARVPVPPGRPKRSVAAARSWGDAIRSCRPAPAVTVMPAQRTLVAALQSTISDVGLGRARQRTDGSATPASSRPSTTEALRAQQRGSPWGRADAQWKLDDDQDVLERIVSDARSSSPKIRPELHALQAVPGAGVIGQRHEMHPMWSSRSDIDSGLVALVDPHAAVRQLVGRHEEQTRQLEQEAAQPITPQQPRTSACELTSDRPVVVHRKAGNFRQMVVKLGGTQYTGVAEPRRQLRLSVNQSLMLSDPQINAERRPATVVHIDDIHHTPKSDTRGLIPADRSQALLVRSTPRLAAARLRHEGVYVTGVVQPILPASVFWRDHHPTATASSTITGNHASQVDSESSPAVRRPKKRSGIEPRGSIGPFEDGASGCQYFAYILSAAEASGADMLIRCHPGSWAHVRPWTAPKVDIAGPFSDQNSPTTLGQSPGEVAEQAKRPSGWAPTHRSTTQGASSMTRPCGSINSDGVGEQEQQPRRGLVPPPLPQPHLPP